MIAQISKVEALNLIGEMIDSTINGGTPDGNFISETINSLQLRYENLKKYNKDVLEFSDLVELGLMYELCSYLK